MQRDMWRRRGLAERQGQFSEESFSGSGRFPPSFSLSAYLTWNFCFQLLMVQQPGWTREFFLVEMQHCIIQIFSVQVFVGHNRVQQLKINNLKKNKQNFTYVDNIANCTVPSMQQEIYQQTQPELKNWAVRRRDQNLLSDQPILFSIVYMYCTYAQFEDDMKSSCQGRKLIRRSEQAWETRQSNYHYRIVVGRPSLEYQTFSISWSDSILRLDT